jgi:hypothetical protein
VSPSFSLSQILKLRGPDPEEGNKIKEKNKEREKKS